MKPNILLALFFFSLTGICKAQVNQSDSLALVDLYNATQPSNGWKNDAGWLTKAPLNQWYGIGVTGDRVTSISLVLNRLTGTMPLSFGNLSALQTLDLNTNKQLSIKLNKVLPTLVKLQYLDLHLTKTSGSIPPGIGSLTDLGFINLSSCSLTGTLPGTIGNLAKLGTLILGSNGISGAVPQSLGQLSQIRTLDLSANNFSGPLPSAGYYPKLMYLTLNDNHFSGNFPDWFGKSTPLSGVNISHNDFTGPLPASLDTIYFFGSLVASYNHFSGAIPEGFLTKYWMIDLYVDHNELYNPANPCIQLGSNLYNMDISNNKYSFNGLECISPSAQQYTTIGPQGQIKIAQKGNQLTVSAGGTLSNNTYTWYKVGSAQSRVLVGDSSVTPTQSGRYYAKVTNKAVTVLTLYTDTVTYTKAAGVSAPSLSLSPNPTRGLITVYGLDDNRDATVRIADLTGHVWLTATSRKQVSVQMNAALLKPGNYMITVAGKEGIKTLAFIKE